MFDASNYVLGPYLYSCWSLVKFWPWFVVISSFLMAVSWWRHRMQCIVTMWSFLRLLKLQASGWQTWSPAGGLTVCHGVLDHALNLHRNIPLRFVPLFVCVTICSFSGNPAILKFLFLYFVTGQSVQSKQQWHSKLENHTFMSRRADQSLFFATDADHASFHLLFTSQNEACQL